MVTYRGIIPHMKCRTKRSLKRTPERAVYQAICGVWYRAYWF